MGNTCWGLSLSQSSHGVRSMADGGMTLFLSSHLSGVPGFSSSLAPLVVSAKNVTVATTLQWKWSQRGGGGGCCWCLLQQVCPTTRDSLTSEDRTLLQDRSEIRGNLLVSPPTKRNHWSEDRNHQPQIRAEMQLRRQSSWIHTQTHTHTLLLSAGASAVFLIVEGEAVQMETDLLWSLRFWVL